MAIEITRQELTAAELRAAAAKTKDSRAARRMPRDRARAGGGGSGACCDDQRDGPADASVRRIRKPSGGGC